MKLDINSGELLRLNILDHETNRPIYNSRKKGTLYTHLLFLSWF